MELIKSILQSNRKGSKENILKMMDLGRSRDDEECVLDRIEVLGLTLSEGSSKTKEHIIGVLKEASKFLEDSRLEVISLLIEASTEDSFGDRKKDLISKASSVGRRTGNGAWFERALSYLPPRSSLN